MIFKIDFLYNCNFYINGKCVNCKGNVLYDKLYFFFFLFKKKYLYIKCVFYDCILSFKNIFVIIVNECVIVIVVDRVF